jgi:hypothetical protein
MDMETVFIFNLTTKMTGGRNLYNEDADIVIDGIIHNFRKGKVYINNKIVGKVNDIEGKTCEIWDEKDILQDRIFIIDGKVHHIINRMLYIDDALIGPIIV